MGINSCQGGEDDLKGADAVISEVGDATLRAECMYPSPGLDRSAQSTVRSVHPGGAFVAMVDGSTQFLSDFIDAGNIGPASYIGQNDEQIKQENFGVWQRLNMAADGFNIQIND